MRASQTRRVFLHAAIAASLCCGVLAAPLAAAGAPWQGALLTDAVSSWWTRPNSTYQPRHGITYMTGVSSAGDWVWGAYDHKSGVTTRRSLGKARPDDHNTPAIVAPADKPPIVFYTGHNSTSTIRYRISRKVGDWLPGPERVLPMPGKVTYVQVHRGRTPNTLLLLTRCGDQWLLAVSGNYGVSWTTRPLVSFDSGTYGYLITSQLADGTIRICAAGHPTYTNLTAIYYAQIDPVGDLRSAEGSVVANIYTGSGLPIAAPRDLQTIYTLPAEKDVRLFDVSASPSPEVLFAEWYGHEEASYVYLKRNDLGWMPTVLTPTGRPIGFTYTTRYLGGATFPNPTPGGEFFLSRETAGLWRVERWRQAQGGWRSELISQSSRILARPSAPLGASPQLPLLWLGLTAYDHYTEFEGSTYGRLPQGKPGPRRSGTAIAGDWDGDGTAEPGVFKAGYWTLRVGNRTTRFRFGRKGDTPLVGDWDGDGKDGVAVRRGRTWMLSNTIAPASVYRRFSFGGPNDKPIVGDWDGNGADGIGVRRKATWYLKNSLRSGKSKIRFDYGRSTDVPVVGDWTDSGKDGVGVKRGSTWKLRRDLGPGRPQIEFTFGGAKDAPVVGDWGALGKDSPGVRRGSTGVWYVIDSVPGVPRSNFAPNRFRF